MHVDAHHRHLAFLLSFGAMPLACDLDQDEAPCEAGHDDSKGDDDDDEGGGSDGDTTGNDPGGTTGGSDPTEDPSADPTENPGTADPSAGETTTGEMVDPVVCQPYVDHYVECFPMGNAESLLEGCIYSVQSGHDHSPECGSAVEDWYACLTATACEVVTGGEPYCEAEAAALDAECPATEPPDGGSSGG